MERLLGLLLICVGLLSIASLCAVLLVAVVLPGDAMPPVLRASFFRESAASGLYAGLGIGGSIAAAAGVKLLRK